MAIPYSTTGSLSPTFVSAPLVGVAVKLPSAFALLQMVSNHPEGTFERLRYSLGGDRPSQTVHQTLSAYQDNCVALEFQITKGGIPRLAPPRLTPWLQSLPPILYIVIQNSMSNYSKALRGLSV